MSEMFEVKVDLRGSNILFTAVHWPNKFEEKTEKTICQK